MLHVISGCIIDDCVQDIVTVSGKQVMRARTRICIRDGKIGSQPVTVAVEAHEAVAEELVHYAKGDKLQFVGELCSVSDGDATAKIGYLVLKIDSNHWIADDNDKILADYAGL